MRAAQDTQGEVMLDKAKSLLQPSARSAVPPFMVMDVMAAAARLEAQGRRIIHMEVGQPAAGAPAAAIAAARRRCRTARSAIPKRWVSHRCGGASRRAYGNATASTSTRSASWSPPAPRPALSWRSSPPSSRAIALPWRCRVIRPIAISLPRSAASRWGLRPTAQTRWSITSEILLAAASRAAAQGRGGSLSGQSDGNDDGCAQALARSDPLRRRCRHRRHLRRDLSRPRLRLPGRERRANFVRRRSSSTRSPNISA